MARANRAATWGPDSPAAKAGDQRWFGPSRFGLTVLALNPHDPLLADPDVRRAISLALDRTAISAMSGDAPTIDPLPPSMPGSPREATAVPPPDIAAAKALMEGRTGTLVWADCGQCASFSDAIRSNLAQIGITLDVRILTDDAGGPDDPKTEIDMVGWGLDPGYPVPVAASAGLASNDWIGTADIAELERLGPIAGQARLDDAATLAQQLAAAGLVIPVGYATSVLYLGADVGCGRFQPAIAAVDLLSLCRKP